MSSSFAVKSLPKMLEILCADQQSQYLRLRFLSALLEILSSDNRRR